MTLEALHTWFLSLGTQYGVNPYIFGTIYVGAIPFFMASVAWLVKRQRSGRSIALPVMCTGLCAISAYIYLAIAGHGIPIWVWLVIAGLVFYGGWTTVRSVRQKVLAGEENEH